MTSQAISVDEKADVIIFFCNKSISKKIVFLDKFYIIYHFLSLCVFISVQNIGRSIPCRKIFIMPKMREMGQLLEAAVRYYLILGLNISPPL